MGRHVATGKCLFAKVIFKNKKPDTEIYSCLKVNGRKIICDYMEKKMGFGFSLQLFFVSLSTLKNLIKKIFELLLPL